MDLTIRIHPSWLQRPDALRRLLGTVAALEHEAPTPPETAGPGRPAPARTGPARGDAWEPPQFDEFGGPDPGSPALTPSPRTSGREEPEEEESPPQDGRQLLGWASKQDPDAKGLVMSFGKRNGYPSKIVSWGPEQVRAAYRHARAAQRPTGR
jgi:hypothetical protein